MGLIFSNSLLLFCGFQWKATELYNIRCAVWIGLCNEGGLSVPVHLNKHEFFFSFGT